jgi:energy-coupling factor transporter ATP-binding protein EcfA2
MTFLKTPDLLKNINELIGKSGIAGEENNRLLLFTIASSYKMPDTLHALIQGSSGSGKTRLMKIIADLMPEEQVKRYTRVTDNSFYNQDEYFFVNKLVCFEDLDGLKEDAQLAVRELQSNEILRTSTSIKDQNGSISGGERVVRGPIASLACTTRGEIYEDNVSRSFLIAVDESPEQTQRVIEYQNRLSAGQINKREQNKAKVFLQNCMRLLQSYEVINPFASSIQLPREAHKIRRLNELYQSFVRQITLLNQYRRKKDKQGRLITQREDMKAACDILFESIILKVDELDGSLRQFFEKLKTYVTDKGKTYSFNRFEIRRMTGVGKTQQHYYINRLVELEYLRQYGHANRGYRYEIAHWDNMSALRSRIKNALNEQLEALRTERQTVKTV